MKFLILFVIFCVSLSPSQGQTKSGFIAGIGTGNLKTNFNPITLEKMDIREIDYRHNYSVGYRFRIHPLAISPLFLDWDANIGMKLWHFAYGQSPRMGPFAYEASSQYFYVSASGTANYPVSKKISIGAGFEPTYYFSQFGESSQKKIDVPLVGKIAYNFKIFELGLNYKYGLMNVVKTDRINSGKFRDWQLSVWIPF